MKKYSSETEMLIQLYISGKAWRNEADKSCNDCKMLQDYMSHVEQQSHGRKTHTMTSAIHLKTYNNRAMMAPYCSTG